VNPGPTVLLGIASRFERLMGSNLVASEPGVLERHAIDGLAPQVILTPESAEQIVAVLRVANEENWTVIPYGGGTRRDVGSPPGRVDIVLSTDRLNQIEVYDPGDLTISLQAGVKVAHVCKKCGEHRQLLPIEALEEATIGGALASAESGPLRAGFGAVRDFCIGINFITGDGMSGRGGGRVVKNVAGYDLMKLMIGSYGSLGVIVSANFKLFPMPQPTMTCLCEFDSLPEAIKLRDWLLKSPLSPIAAEIVSPSALEYLEDKEPRDPDHWAPDVAISSENPKWQMMLRFAGSDRVLARCRRELSASTAREVAGNNEIDFWKRVGNFERRLLARHRNAMVFQLTVPIAESQAALEAAQTSAANCNFVAASVGRATVGAFCVAFLPLAIDPPSVNQFVSAASDFRSRLSKACSAVVIRCPLEAKQHFDVWGSTPTDTNLMQKIKRALDPRDILNRGRFLTG
jgi:glycolate oxidase FAD binding subunit